MINDKTCVDIQEALDNSAAIKRFLKKITEDPSSEKGHSYAQEWQSSCLEVLAKHFPKKIFVEIKKAGQDKMAQYESLSEVEKKYIKKRSLGDFYFYENNLYNPIDAKLQAQDGDGQPNTSSMFRQQDCFMSNKIDSFYVLKLNCKKEEIYLYDIHEHPYCLTYNMGTGQIMTKEKEYQPDKRVQYTTKEKVKNLVELYERKGREHLLLKEQQIESRVKLLQNFGG